MVCRELQFDSYKYNIYNLQYNILNQYLPTLFLTMYLICHRSCRLFRGSVLSRCSSTMTSWQQTRRAWTTSCCLLAPHKDTWAVPRGSVMTPCRQCVLVRNPAHKGSLFPCQHPGERHPQLSTPPVSTTSKTTKQGKIKLYGKYNN